MDAQELARRFTYHAPEGDQPSRYADIRLSAYCLADVINDKAPDSREKRLAISCLEKAVMWANAAIARNG
jgi:hypothetical protein